MDLLHREQAPGFVRLGYPLFRKHLDLYLPSLQSLPCFSRPDPLTLHVTFKLESGRAHHTARPQQFLSWPGYVAYVVVLTSRKPL